MKSNPRMWTAALLGLTLVAGTALSQTYTNIVPKPGVMQPGGASDDVTRNFGTFWTDNGTVSQDIDYNMHSSNNIAGSLHVIMDCPGGTVTPLKSANLAYGNFFYSKWGDNGWLGAGNPFDAAKYEKLTFDIFINNAASSNTALPFLLFGYNYEQAALTNLPLTITGWQHIELSIPANINLPDCTAYGIYNWYNTTASTPPAHVEYWMDNVMLVARAAPLPPPTLSLKPVTEQGLLFDSAPGQGGQRGSIETAADVRWAYGASSGNPITYAMTISAVPDSTVYSNWHAFIFLAPPGGSEWNPSDMAYLQILSQNNGTAIGRMMWKTNDPMDNTMLFNELPGGQYGTNGYAAGTLAYLTAPSMTGAWSITFTSDTDMVVRGPGGVSTNVTLPRDWFDSYNASADSSGGVVHALFGGGPNNNNNAGLQMSLSKVVVGGGTSVFAYTNDFKTPTLDTASWSLHGGQAAIVTPDYKWWVNWTLPAANFNLWSKENLDSATPWRLISGNTNLALPVTAYASGTNYKTLVAAANLPNSGKQTYFAARQLVASKLQVLLPGETNAPFTATGKIGTPDSQVAGASVPVTVNAVDADWNIVTTCSDTIHLTSSDASAVLPATDPVLANGTVTIATDVIFLTAGPQTITATDVTKTTVTAGTSSPVTITQ